MAAVVVSDAVPACGGAGVVKSPFLVGLGHDAYG